MSEVDDYWTRRVEIGRLPLRFEGEQDVALNWHQAREHCGIDHRELGLGTFTGQTEREYVHAKACFLTPDLIVSVAIARPAFGAPASRIGEQVGTVTGSQMRGSIRREFANLQAWYYPTARALILWEVDLWERYRDGKLAEDFILSCLFDGFERELLRVFPDAREAITPHEPNYEDADWGSFLARRGYAPHIDNTYRKLIEQEGK